MLKVKKLSFIPVTVLERRPSILPLLYVEIGSIKKTDGNNKEPKGLSAVTALAYIRYSALKSRLLLNIS
jgi:hypothetical protein